MQGIKVHVDALALMGVTVDSEDLTLKVLHGLDDSYKELSHAIQARDTAISFDELHEKLLTFEAQLAALPSTQPTPTPSTAFAASRNSRPNQHGSSPGYNRSSGGSRGRDPRVSYPSQSRPPATAYNHRPYQGRCQLCGTPGHSAKRCTSFQYLPWSNQSPPTSSQPAYVAPQATRHLFLRPLLFLQTGLWIPVLHIMSLLILPICLCTPRMLARIPLLLAGAGLSISHTGILTLHTSPKSFVLPNTLFVPAMCKNLISVSQLCRSNDVSVVFLPSSFQVKDLRTGATLLTGPCKDGIYTWPQPRPPSLSPSAYTSVSAPLTLWHSRLGHPSPDIVRHLAVSNVFSLSPLSVSDSHCNSCHIN